MTEIALNSGIYPIKNNGARQASAVYLASVSKELPTDKTEFTAKKAFDKNGIVDIKLRGTYPSNVLSNLSDTSFKIDGVEVKSMEGFLQALKVQDPEEQKKFCSMSGLDAKKYSKAIKRDKQETLLFWEGKTFRRDSETFENLLKEVLLTKEASEAKNAKSIFPPTTFKFGGAKIRSVNSFLIALKVSDPTLQKEICKLTSEKAKEKARTIHLDYDMRTLHWNGKSFKRDSVEYLNLLKRAFKERFNVDKSFQKAVEMTKKCTLTHRIGKNDISETILTTEEYIGLLKNLQKKSLYIKIESCLKRAFYTAINLIKSSLKGAKSLKAIL